MGAREATTPYIASFATRTRLYRELTRALIAATLGARGDHS
jgi:hypothetical protein